MTAATRDLPAESGSGQLSGVDRAIIAQLQRNGRAPFSVLASRLGVSEGTVQRRTQQLIEEGYFKIIGVANPLMAPEGQAVLLGLSVETTAVTSVADELATLPEARFVALVTGTFDLICEVVTFDRRTLLDILVERVSTIPGIRSQNTSWVLANYKTNYEWDERGGEQGREPQSDNASEAGQGGSFQAQGCEPRLDELDDQIARLLRVDGRTSYADIAAATGSTVSTARRRTLRLLDSGYLRVVAVGNPFRLGFQEVVMLWIKADLSRIDAILRELIPWPAIRYLSRVAGAADIVAEALFVDRGALLSFLDGPLATLEGIREVAVSFELTIHKRAYVRFDN